MSKERSDLDLLLERIGELVDVQGRSVHEQARLVSVLAGQGDPDRPLCVDSHLTLERLAKLTGKHRNTVLSWVRREQNPLPSYRVPSVRTIMVRWGDFLEWREPGQGSEEAQAMAARLALRVAR